MPFVLGEPRQVDEEITGTIGLEPWGVLEHELDAALEARECWVVDPVRAHEGCEGARCRASAESTLPGTNGRVGAFGNLLGWALTAHEEI